MAVNMEEKSRLQTKILAHLQPMLEVRRTADQHLSMLIPLPTLVALFPDVQQRRDLSMH